MKKSGFTLAELMIALGIIAVAAVIAAPALTDMMPQKDKMRVIKYYTMISDATNEILSDESIYHGVKITGIKDYGSYGIHLSADFDSNKVGTSSCLGLECTNTPANDLYKSSKYSGAAKYKNLLIDKLGLKDNKLPDGSEWTIEEGIPANITIDINGSSKGKNCNHPQSFMDKSTCKNPDKFLFQVDKYGNITGDDPLTRAYLKNPLNMHDKKKDKAVAAQALKSVAPPRRP